MLDRKQFAGPSNRLILSEISLVAPVTQVDGRAEWMR